MRENRKILTGRVVSDKMQKTVVVQVEVRKPHPLYRRIVRYTSRYNTWGRSNDPAYYRDEVVLLNANAGLTSSDERWSLGVYGRNLTNEKVMSGAVSAGATPIQQFYQAPREFGVDLTARF